MCETDPEPLPRQGPSGRSASLVAPLQVYSLPPSAPKLRWSISRPGGRSPQPSPRRRGVQAERSAHLPAAPANPGPASARPQPAPPRSPRQLRPPPLAPAQSRSLGRPPAALTAASRHRPVAWSGQGLAVPENLRISALTAEPYGDDQREVGGDARPWRPFPPP